MEFHPVCWKKQKSIQEGKAGDKVRLLVVEPQIKQCGLALDRLLLQLIGYQTPLSDWPRFNIGLSASGVDFLVI